MYAVLDENGIVLETWRTRTEPPARTPSEKGKWMVRTTPGAVDWVPVAGSCVRGDRLAVDEEGYGTVPEEGPPYLCSGFYWVLDRVAADAVDLNEHTLTRTLYHLRVLLSAEQTATAEQLLEGPADRVRRSLGPGGDQDTKAG